MHRLVSSHVPLENTRARFAMQELDPMLVGWRYASVCSRIGPKLAWQSKSGRRSGERERKGWRERKWRGSGRGDRCWLSGGHGGP